MEIQFIVLYILVGISIAVGAAVFMKVKTAIYLLEQPVVKKMSPQLNLKPVKTDHFEGGSDRGQSRNGATATAGGRPEGRDGRDRGPREGGRDGRDRDRGPRPEGERGPRVESEGRREGGDRGPRGERGDRFGGRDRDRGGRDGRDRHDRGDRGPGGRGREFAGNEQREPAHGESRPAPTADITTPAPLAPRRPLPSTIDSEGEARPAPAAESALAVNEAGAADPFFGRDDSDIQHGRRTQMKKKPKFDAEEIEEKAEETKV